MPNYAKSLFFRHVQTCSHGGPGPDTLTIPDTDPPPPPRNMFKIIHYVAQISAGKQVVGIPLKCLLVLIKY